MIRTTLSQWHGSQDVLQPCAFYSWKLTPIEQNYEICDKELLPINATEEWHHHQEDTHVRVQVYVDHRNLEYWQIVKALNQCRTS